ncbi:MAG: peptidase T [Lachnospiraceae bacterium]|nr:peptidase T [Lachnospiraceae bacterium]
MDVLERFLTYVKVDTQSAEDREEFPSTEKQKVLGRMLKDELISIGASDVVMDENGYVYAKIPETDGGKQKRVLGFLSHMDTSPDASGLNVKPQVVADYDGGDILLNEEKKIVLSPENYPELSNYVGKTIITSDGTTLLGADDKAGVSEIMTMAEYLLKHPELEHGPIAIAFTPDEEVGRGVDFFNLEQFGADVAYTVDGGGLGELEYENFNAASLTVTVHGISVHPGDAKNKMKNAVRIGMEYDCMLPEAEKPELTEGYEGFFHLLHFTGDVEEAKLVYIIRDHDRAKFEQKKALAENIGRRLDILYGGNTVETEINDSYYNMKEKIEPDYYFLIENAAAEMEKLGIKPLIRPIRGGTDGARLSFMGLPCPNICTGGHNFHGRFEYCVLESMEAIVKILIGLCTAGSENC